MSTSPPSPGMPPEDGLPPATQDAFDKAFEVEEDLKKGQYGKPPVATKSRHGLLRGCTVCVGWGELDVKEAMKMGDVDAAVLHWCQVRTPAAAAAGRRARLTRGLVGMQNACKSSWMELLILNSILLNTVLLAVSPNRLPTAFPVLSSPPHSRPPPASSASLLLFPRLD